MSEQGGYEAPGYDKLPNFKALGWVATSTGSYGYGCGCLNVKTDLNSMRISQICFPKPVRLAVCIADKKLPKRVR